MITGMRDYFCRERVADAIQAVPGVTQVDVSLYRARAIVEHDGRCEPAALLKAVAGAGCTAELER